MRQSLKQTLPELSAKAHRSLSGDLSPVELRLIHKGFASLRKADENVLGAKEKRKSVCGLIDSVACDLGINEDVIRAQVQRHFDLSDLGDLHFGRYDELVRFLKDMNIKQVLN